MANNSGDFVEKDEHSKPLRLIQSRFDELRVYKSSFTIAFPLLHIVIDVDLGSEIVDICSTHCYVVVVTGKHIYIAHKDELESPLKCSYELKDQLNLSFEPASWHSNKVQADEKAALTTGWSKNEKKNVADVVLTSTLSTVYLVYTVDNVSTVVRLFNEYSYAESDEVRPVIVQIPEDIRITMAVSGNDHSLFLTDKGAVYALGTGSRGELGIGLIPRVTELTWVEALEGVHVTTIAAAGWHSAALTNDGDVYVWGWNHRGQLGDEKEKVELYPLPLDIDLRVVKIELRDHLTALWVAEDGDEPSIVMGLDEIGMLPFRLQYYDVEPDKKTEEKLASDTQVDMVFLSGKELLRDGDGEFEYPIRDKD
ncbi:unnamed protein product [Cylicocyclus nassatus]|uniref:Uncharacterized protein n=1 Tax=Cylicocyclus nassatus TaxID=53992 RepID=A0AA36M1H1_CYLNA|nr:unnamed protein product [Cylicocyclus nassatus]